MPSIGKLKLKLKKLNTGLGALPQPPGTVAMPDPPTLPAYAVNDGAAVAGDSAHAASQASPTRAGQWKN
jgi:hypothetical protein